MKEEASFMIFFCWNGRFDGNYPAQSSTVQQRVTSYDSYDLIDFDHQKSICTCRQCDRKFKHQNRFDVKFRHTFADVVFGPGNDEPQLAFSEILSQVLGTGC